MGTKCTTCFKIQSLAFSRTRRIAKVFNITGERKGKGKVHSTTCHEGTP
jgi:hypothetical protein